MMVILRVHILAVVTSHVFPLPAWDSITLDEHCMRDRDWIPQESIHYIKGFCKTFPRKKTPLFIFLCILYVELGNAGGDTFPGQRQAHPDRVGAGLVPALRTPSLPSRSPHYHIVSPTSVDNRQQAVYTSDNYCITPEIFSA
jgi:hypothetical protein